MRIAHKKTWLSVFFLTAIEQGIKIIINRFYLDLSAPILAPFLYFEPMFNRDYSWLNSMLQLGINKWLHISFVVIAMILIYWFYQFFNLNPASNFKINQNKDLSDSADEPDPANFSTPYRKNLNVLTGSRFNEAGALRSGNQKIIHLIFAFLFSSAICSLLDKVFWDGSLDYIMVSGLFTFDLKDVYINAGIGLLLLVMITKNRTLQQMDDQSLGKEFLTFILRKFTFKK